MFEKKVTFIFIFKMFSALGELWLVGKVNKNFKIKNVFSLLRQCLPKKTRMSLNLPQTSFLTLPNAGDCIPSTFNQAQQTSLATLIYILYHVSMYVITHGTLLTCANFLYINILAG